MKLLRRVSHGIDPFSLCRSPLQLSLVLYPRNQAFISKAANVASYYGVRVKIFVLVILFRLFYCVNIENSILLKILRKILRIAYDKQFSWTQFGKIKSMVNYLKNLNYQKWLLLRWWYFKILFLNNRNELTYTRQTLYIVNSCCNIYISYGMLYNLSIENTILLLLLLILTNIWLVLMQSINEPIERIRTLIDLNEIWNILLKS